MIRSSVVFPDPDGPSSARSEPDPTSRLTLFKAVNAPNCLLTFRMLILICQNPFEFTTRVYDSVFSRVAAIC